MANIEMKLNEKGRNANILSHTHMAENSMNAYSTEPNTMLYISKYSIDNNGKATHTSSACS